MLAAARVAFLVAFSLAAALGGPEETVDWREAAQCVGRVCAVRGTVAVSEDDGPTIRLYFDAERRDVRVLLMRGWLVTWPHYDGATIVATGKVHRFRDHIEMIVLSPDNVEVLDGMPSATSTAESTPTASPASSPTWSFPAQPTPTTASIATPTSRSEAVATAVPAPAPSPGEVEQLRQRVRELEERVRELEGP
jgi:hypothetical protein